MSAPDRNKTQPGPSASKVDLVLLCLVLALGLFSARAFFLRQAPPAPPSTVAQAPEAGAGRGPASLSTSKAEVKERSTRILELGCLDEKITRVQTEAGLLRLVADSCAGSVATEARNETTGEKLLLFKREKKISTHYFPLKSGSNKIVIEWKIGAKKGVAKILEVERGGQL